MACNKHSDSISYCVFYCGCYKQRGEKYVYILDLTYDYLLRVHY